MSGFKSAILLIDVLNAAACKRAGHTSLKAIAPIEPLYATILKIEKEEGRAAS